MSDTDYETEARELAQAYAEKYNEGLDFEYWTESAEYANNVLPRLRAIAGYDDAGYGTYTDAPSEEVYYIFDEVFEAFYDELGEHIPLSAAELEEDA